MPERAEKVLIILAGIRGASRLSPKPPPTLRRKPRGVTFLAAALDVHFLDRDRLGGCAAQNQEVAHLGPIAARLLVDTDMIETGMMSVRNMRILTVAPVASAPEDGVILKIPEDVPLVAKWLPSKPANGVSKKIAFT
ncbi:hypothetical protein PGTUg99_014301 [Puccinia graminis f. sp. tritici]|uniref:Uncharacterized protein n=1 Tax=Puccinia graminis f. sp. tritici TaxID=56615 RepID=A0A5B0NUP2_PUCGR|nr:hypothetical protein PGTUg99_014301 [Puccinia graminis f. sp. tritici]